MKANKYRSHTCGDLSAKDTGNTVTLTGWVNSHRDHGGVVFFNLRDRYGVTQVVCTEKDEPKLAEVAKKLHSEYLVTIEGKVRSRPKEALNKTMATGEIEVAAAKMKILSYCKELPFDIDVEEEPVNDIAILKYRYLYLRRESAKQMIIQRYKITKAVRDFLHDRGFLELETPMLTKTTPEGARDFLVPSRNFPGTFYALPQSPQQYKELLMVAGFDRYFQIARAMRDEDPRIDRQPEHTQIDMEMCFVEQDDILELLEEMFIHLVENVSDRKLKFKPLPRITYAEAMEKYGTDKPDLRFEMEIVDISSPLKGCKFRVFSSVLADGGMLKAIVIPECGSYSRKKLDKVVEKAKEFGLKGLVWVIPGENKIRSSAGKNLSEDEFSIIIEKTGAKQGDLIVIAADKREIALLALGQLRNYFGNLLGLCDPKTVAFAFIVDFPMFKWDEEGKRFDPLHHMFVRPKEEDIPLLDSNPGKVIGSQFDMVCNGYELCSGSLRIHQRELQEKVMRMIGLSDEEIQSMFGHLLNAFEYGAPPHGGAAPGLDRLVMVLTGATCMRDVVVFPKTQSGKDLLMDAPTPPSEVQLKELALKIDYQSMKPEWVEQLKSQKSFDQRTF